MLLVSDTATSAFVCGAARSFVGGVAFVIAVVVVRGVGVGVCGVVGVVVVVVVGGGGDDGLAVSIVVVGGGGGDGLAVSIVAVGGGPAGCPKRLSAGSVTGGGPRIGR